MTVQQARNLKAHQIRKCRSYLRRANDLGLTPNGTFVRYWTQELQAWRLIPIPTLLAKRNHDGNHQKSVQRPHTD